MESAHRLPDPSRAGPGPVSPPPSPDLIPEPALSLTDSCGRRLDYLRLSVTDRCNLRCGYCMPAEGISLVRRQDLLDWEQMLTLCERLVGLGVRKIRITGGEPLVRRGLMPFLARLRELRPEPGLFMTTNGILLADSLPELWDLGLRRLNVSLDSLRSETFRAITRRDAFAQVWRSLEAATDAGFALKLNVVVQAGVNCAEIADFVALTRDCDWTVRFIEPMPFLGTGRSRPGPPPLDGEEILRRIRRRFVLEPVAGAAAGVDDLYRVPGHRGQVGVICGHSRTFCDRCSRLRLSARGKLRTCLYGRPVLDLGRMLREGTSGGENNAATATETVTAIDCAIRAAVDRRFRDGHAAEASNRRGNQGRMSRIGG